MRKCLLIWLPIVSHRANSLFHSPLTDMFSECLKTHLLSGPAKRRRDYLSVMAEIERASGLEVAIEAAERAAFLELETIIMPIKGDH